MSSSNGVIRIGRKGLKKFAFGDDGPEFEVDVVVAFQQWIAADEGFRPPLPDADGNRPIPTADMPKFHETAVEFVTQLANAMVGTKEPAYPPGAITTAEALDFLARLREQYDELAAFFRPRSREKQGSSDTSAEGSQRFSEETVS